jgi:predicted ArsR family transcriptional regulator|tara:strand:+ start:1197 stop:1442 length:246 start_codon:yes stop_codon:yes gene_type:complete
MSKMERVLEVLSTGQELTGKQIQARFGVGNARATVSALRMKGYPIYANEHKDTKGRVKTKYRLGSPSRAVIAAGYRALAGK